MNLGNRMKHYEALYASSYLLPMIPTIARIDGRSFHTFCKDLSKPYDDGLSNLMIETTKFLVEETGANCGYTQSDEISLTWLSNDYKSEIFFRGRLLKMVSVLSSLTTAFFIKNLGSYLPSKKDHIPTFDSRVFNVPTTVEASNYFLWRERDATKNSISMAAQCKFSHQELHKKNGSEMQEMLFQKGINWNDYPTFFKRGTYVQRQSKEIPYSCQELEKLPLKHAARQNPNLLVKRWVVGAVDMPPFAKIVNREAVIFDGEPPAVKE